MLLMQLRQTQGISKYYTTQVAPSRSKVDARNRLSRNWGRFCRNRISGTQNREIFLVPGEGPYMRQNI